jgi:epoxyqueuosine reductase
VRLEAKIRQYATALGFSACGFAAAVPLARGAFLEGWLDAGFAGEMRYLERRAPRRLSVAGTLRDARTVVTLAYPYNAPPLALTDWQHEFRGRIAAYAIGEDYHRVLGRKLATLEAFIIAQAPQIRARRYVDTAAILEREWAMRGGIGWFGKNTMLLNARAGSWFFLAELVTTLALAPDPPAAAHCGRCTRCRDTCPTGALRDDFVMDARLCISYLTIEHRSAIPRALRSKLGPWVFGCDVCQEVCPWNGTQDPATLTDAATATRRGATGPHIPDGEHAASAWLNPHLPTLLSLDEPGFRSRFATSPVARAKRRGLLRNVAVALGNTGNPAAVPALAGALADQEPLIRGHAAWALGVIGVREARRALERHRYRERDAFVVEEIAAALDTPSA